MGCRGTRTRRAPAWGQGVVGAPTRRGWVQMGVCAHVGVCVCTRARGCAHPGAGSGRWVGAQAAVGQGAGSGGSGRRQRCGCGGALAGRWRGRVLPGGAGDLWLRQGGEPAGLPACLLGGCSQMDGPQPRSPQQIPGPPLSGPADRWLFSPGSAGLRVNLMAQSDAGREHLPVCWAPCAASRYPSFTCLLRRRAPAVQGPAPHTLPDEGWQSHGSLGVPSLHLALGDGQRLSPGPRLSAALCSGCGGGQGWDPPKPVQEFGQHLQLPRAEAQLGAGVGEGAPGCRTGSGRRAALRWLR